MTGHVAPVKHKKTRSSILSVASRMTLPAMLGMPFAPALAADLSALDDWRSLLPVHGGWTLLAGLGLLAVAVAALTVRRPHGERLLDDGPLGRMRDDAETRSLPAPAPELAPTFVPEPDQDAVAAVGWSRPAAVDAPGTQPSRPANGSQLFLALHHVDLSIEVLHRHLQRELRPMPAVWMMLLDLCRTHGREQKFRELALEFHQRFNVCAPSWEGFPPGRDDPGLEAHPRLVREVMLAWGTHECARLLDRLLYDNRGSERRGFALNAYNDLIALRRAAGAVLDTIEQDLTEEAKVRSAFASASADASDATGAPANARTAKSPLVSDLESQLEGDLRTNPAPQSTIEREHPALAGMLAREWGNAAMSARLCDMLARGGDGTHALSKEAAEEIELLRKMAERLHAGTDNAVMTSEPG